MPADPPKILDGGFGSELKRRGVALHPDAWSASVLFSHPQLIREVHLDYLRAGADILTTNTFATNAFQLAGMGARERLREANEIAVAAARSATEAAAEFRSAPVTIAGSLSNLPPGFDRAQYPPMEEAADCYHQLAATLAELGVDLLLLEMLQDLTHAPALLDAALATGLPVWVGISCRELDGDLVGFDRTEIKTEEVLDCLLPRQPALVGIMHTPIDTMPRALATLRKRWSGPLAAYPEIDYEGLPQAAAQPVTPARFADAAANWMQFAPAVIGGCCGTTPEHIQALRSRWPQPATLQSPGPST